MIVCSESGMGDYVAEGYQMINSIEIDNFKCYRSVKIENCKRVNILTGENGGGKTTLLEAMFLALGYNAHIAFVLRAWRGYPAMNGPTAAETERMHWEDHFHNFDTKKFISVKITGSAAETRSVQIGRGTELPLPDMTSDLATPISFVWRDVSGASHVSTPQPSFDGSLQYPSTFQSIPLECTFLAAQAPVSNPEVAARFSALSIQGKSEKISSLITNAFPTIRGLSVESPAGVPMLYASVTGLPQKIPLISVSSGMNRIVSGLTALCKPKSILLVDEIETGIYYNHLVAMWTMLISAAIENDSQLFATTHSNECLQAFAEASANVLEDIELWRTVAGDDGISIERLSGRQMKSALARQIEIR